MKAIFFDLDNTLYDNKQYFLGAFKDISNYLSKKYSISQEKVYKNLIMLWQEKTSAYPYLFNDLLEISGIKNGGLVEKIVRIFNKYKGNLKPYSGVIATLQELKKRGYKLGIITDGNAKRQKRKIKLLGIKNFFDVIIYTKKIASKPSEKPFLAAVKKMKINPENFFYVADSPLVDFKGAKKIGMKTIRILRGEFKNIPKNKYIDFEINRFGNILKVI